MAIVLSSREDGGRVPGVASLSACVGGNEVVVKPWWLEVNEMILTEGWL